MSRWTIFSFAGALALVVTRCGDAAHTSNHSSGDPAARALLDRPAALGSARDHVVVIIDKGFDPSHPVFKDKVVGQYTVTCTEGDDPAEQTGKTFDELKTLVLANIAKASPCELKEGVSLNKSPAFATIAPLRDAWNQSIVEKRLDREAANFADVSKVLAGGDGGYLYHGTATAALVAYKNPDVKLVLLDLESLAASDQEVTKDLGCPAQTDVDTYVQVMQDADVRKAYVEATPDPLETKLHELIVKHGVTLGNFSAGGVPTRVLEAYYVQKGCAAVHLDQRTKALAELSRARDEWLESQNFYEGEKEGMLVQAAGNDGVIIDSNLFSGDCPYESEDRILVGATNPDQTIASFSNRGDCVFAYTLGHPVIVAAPDGWLTMASGTSFAAPILTRYLTQKFPPGTSSEAMKAGLKSQLIPGNQLPNFGGVPELAVNGVYKVDSYTLAEAPLESPPKMPPRLHDAIIGLFRRR